MPANRIGTLCNLSGARSGTLCPNALRTVSVQGPWDNRRATQRNTATQAGRNRAASASGERAVRGSWPGRAAMRRNIATQLGVQCCVASRAQNATMHTKQSQRSWRLGGACRRGSPRCQRGLRECRGRSAGSSFPPRKKNPEWPRSSASSSLARWRQRVRTSTKVSESSLAQNCRGSMPLPGSKGHPPFYARAGIRPGQGRRPRLSDDAVSPLNVERPNPVSGGRGGSWALVICSCWRCC
jgi:hypothetical protein